MLAILMLSFTLGAESPHPLRCALEQEVTAAWCGCTPPARSPLGTRLRFDCVLDQEPDAAFACFAAIAHLKSACGCARCGLRHRLRGIQCRRCDGYATAG